MKNKTWRRLNFGLQTLFGLARRGFFIPYRYAKYVPLHLPAYKELEKVFSDQCQDLQKFCLFLDRYTEQFSRFTDLAAPAPRWDQDWFPRLDGAAAYGLVRQNKPSMIVEVGSGHSTRFIAQAVVDEQFPCRHIAIDPAPRASIQKLKVEWGKELLNEAHISLFAALQKNDIAFFDSSHILMPGTDVDIILNRIFPTLRPGVLIHIHDIFLPDPYPDDWTWRGYNEQNALGPLIAGGAYDLIFSSSYVVNRLKEAFIRSKVGQLPLNPGAFETSLWLRKR